MATLEEIIALLPRASKADRNLIKKAYEFAERAHADQLRYSGAPYVDHLTETAKKLAELGMPAEVIVAGLLHDSVEDGWVEKEEIKKEFGEEVNFLVEGVTKLGQLRYRGLARHTESLRKLFVATSKDIRVLIIKLADRLHNIQTLKHVPKEKQKRIALETLEIYAPLAYRLGIRKLHKELEDEAFKYVYPEEFEKVLKLFKEKRNENEKHLEKMARSIKKEFAKARFSYVKIDYRIKGLYSLYKKLVRKDMDIEKIYDISALRIIVKTEADCYQALGLIHNTWRPLPGRIRDYIALPKPNGYQSIHTTIFTGDGGILEIQIRTSKMHREAEYGVASHLSYKEGIRRNIINPNLLWIQQLLPKRMQINRKQVSENSGVPQWLQDMPILHADMSGEELVENLKSDFSGFRIFVFTPLGDVVDLPINSTPIDFAYSIHSDIGNHISGAKINGKMVSLDTKLQNGDIVEIQTKKSSAPSHKWLNSAKTSLARKHIKLAVYGKNSKSSK